MAVPECDSVADDKRPDMLQMTVPEGDSGVGGGPECGSVADGSSRVLQMAGPDVADGSSWV